MDYWNKTYTYEYMDVDTTSHITTGKHHYPIITPPVGDLEASICRFSDRKQPEVKQLHANYVVYTWPATLQHKIILPMSASTISRSSCTALPFPRLTCYRLVSLIDPLSPGALLVELRIGWYIMTCSDSHHYLQIRTRQFGTSSQNGHELSAPPMLSLISAR